ncbi:MAG TPA: hypothetical protein VGH97_03970 [Thermoanaerobaculia bacterium]|jgi:hypothetical protein
MSESSRTDPLRRIAAERGRLLGELGVRPEDARWARLEADAIAGLVTPELPIRMPRALARWWHRLRRAGR